MKGIILSGGTGTRLQPLTNYTSKQLLPVYDKPMIYYPLTTLMLGGISDIAIITTVEDKDTYEKLLGDGKEWGINLSYYTQEKPLGLAHSFIVCEEFIGNDKVCLILGDNIFYGNLRISELVSGFTTGASIWGYSVKDPKRYGVIEFNDNGELVDIVEKPGSPPSNYAIPGLYVYDSSVVNKAKSMTPSPRGELEITDLNRLYLQEKNLHVQILGRGIVWFDTGTPQSLLEASEFISSVERTQNYKIGCPEEVAIRQNFISLEQYDSLIKKMHKSDYRSYLVKIREEFNDILNTKYKIISDLQF